MNKKDITSTIIAIAIPVIYGLTIVLLSDLSTFDGLIQLMTVSFIFVIPTFIGVLSILLSPIERVRNGFYQFSFPWVPISILILLTIFFALEGLICWLIILPVFLIASSIGDLIGGYFKLRNHRNDLSLSILIILPFIIFPLEQFIGSIQKTYNTYTYIDIDAPVDKIWKQVTKVEAIPPELDKGYLTKIMGFPRPVKAELNYEGEGAYREAVFTKGLIPMYINRLLRK